MEESDCPFGWIDLASLVQSVYTFHIVMILGITQLNVVKHTGLLSWIDRNEYMNLKYYITRISGPYGP